MQQRSKNTFQVIVGIPRLLADLITERIGNTGESESEIVNKAIANEFGITPQVLAEYKTFRGQENKKINRTRGNYRKPTTEAQKFLETVETGVEHYMSPEDLDLSIMANNGKNLKKL